MKVVVTKYLNIRVGAPSVNAPNLQYLLPGSVIETDGKLYKGDWYEGNAYWYRDESGNYYWSGGVKTQQRKVDLSRIIIDLHCHPSLKPYNNPQKANIWTKLYNPEIKDLFNKKPKDFLARICGLRKETDSFATYSQSNLEACFEGRNKVIFASIYPVERPFVRPDRPFEIAPNATQEEIKKRKRMASLFGKGTSGSKADLSMEERLIQVITGFSPQKAKNYVAQIQNEDTVIDYFRDFLGEYHVLKKAQQADYPILSKGIRAKLKLVNSYSDLEALQTHEIAAIINIEGAHSLGIYSTKDLLNVSNVESPEFGEEKQSQLEQKMNDRIAILKGQKEYTYENQTQIFEHTPFYLTLSHHFNNLISGHAESFTGFGLFNQENGKNGILTKMGKRIINQLISPDNGRRILIDTKHMSIETREEYHQTAIAEGVPIICSHTAVNGLPTFEAAKAIRGNANIDKNSYISRMDINLTDRDIEDIYESEGIIGVCMHDGRMPGSKFKEIIQEIQGEFTNARVARVNRFYVQLFLMNVFHIVKINKKYIEKNGGTRDISSAWDTVCLGTDFDGIIDPFNHLNTAANLESFKALCVDALENKDKPSRKKEGSQILLIDENGTQPYDKDIIDELMMGIPPRLLMDKVFSVNLVNFLKKYYNDDYLLGKT